MQTKNLLECGRAPTTLVVLILIMTRLCDLGPLVLTYLTYQIKQRLHTVGTIFTNGCVQKQTEVIYAT